MTQKLTSQHLIDTLNSSDLLPRLPSVMIELQRALQQPEISAKDIEDIIMKDSRLTVAILQTANTPKYSHNRQIDNLSEAIVRLGISEINNIAHQVSLSGLKIGCKTIQTKAFLKNALLSAYIAKELARAIGVGLNPNHAFLCGLFHDMGLALMDIFNPPNFAQLVPQLDDDLAQQVSCERFHIGLSHPAVAGTLVKNWGFAQEIVMGIAGHHSPAKLQGRDADYAYITYLAELGSRLKGFSFGYFNATQNQAAQAQNALAHFGLDEDYYLNLIDDAHEIYEGSVVI